jgi:hypothetical protein
MLRSWTLTALLTLGACGGGETPAPADPATPPTETPAAPANPENPPFNPETAAAEASNVTLVPSVVETQKALAAAGIEAKLATLITPRNFDLASKDTDKVAVRTGVILADMLLTVSTSEKDKLTGDLDTINAAMQLLGGGADIQATLTDVRERVKNDEVTRGDLLKEMDELAGAVIPELNFNGQQRIVPLIQAGSWLEAANLVSRAMKGTENLSAADSLLKQPAVVDYFIKYVKTEGAEKAPEGVTRKLEESLGVLKALAAKSEPLTAEDIDTIIKTTDDVLALL